MTGLTLFLLRAVRTEQVEKEVGKNIYYIPFAIKNFFEPHICITYSKH